MANFEKFARKLVALETTTKGISEELSNAEYFNIAKEGGHSRPIATRASTVLGVTLGTFKTYFGAKNTLADLLSINYAQWSIIARGSWNACHCDDIEYQCIADILADWYFLSGASAIRRLQMMFGVKTDGIVTAKMMAYLNSPNHEVIFNRIQAARESFYRKAAMTDPSNQKYLGYWLTRTNSFKYTGD